MFVIVEWSAEALVQDMSEDKGLIVLGAGLPRTGTMSTRYQVGELKRPITNRTFKGRPEALIGW